MEGQMPGFIHFHSCIASRIPLYTSGYYNTEQRAVREVVPNSPMLLEYTTFMKGVDVADQLQSLYSSQSRSHKWWYRIF